MAHIVEITNPFNRKDTRTIVHPGGITIRAFLGELYGPYFEDFAKPTICTVNGTPLLRDQWGKYRIKPKDVIHFRTFPGDPVTIIYWVIAIVTIISAAIVLTQSMPTPGVPGSTPEPDPVFDLKGQRNQIRLGNPIEVPYGRCRLWPSYAARPYNKFIDNDQYQYQLFCLGQGFYDIEKIQIEDTLIANFQDVHIEIYEPGDSVTLFPDNVQTSTEVGGIELFGPNQAEYTGAAGPFTANDAGTLTNRLEVDVSLPVGLYLADKASGMLSSQFVAVDFQYREIDDAGVPVGGGDWLTLEYFERELATNTPQRYTLEKEVTPGRYEVRATRANNKNLDTKAGNVARWDAMRSFLPSTKDYGNVTLIAMKARATNNLNDRAANRFNVVATRKLRTRVDGAWTALTATRSIVWAFADIFQAQYGGRLADAYLDLSALEALDAIYTEKGWNFDFVFDQRSTVWDCARVIARCGRAIPMLEGSRVTMIRDFAKSAPTAVFNQENMVQNSFRWDVKLVNIDEFDGLEVEYTDPDTFLPETVKCLVGEEVGDNLEQIKFPGCTDRTHAFREGMYMRASKILLVENITFQTGLEGHIPTYGDLIQVVHDLPKWGSGGLVKSIGLDFQTLQLNEPVTFGAGTHKIAFRKKNGDTAGPYTVTAGSNSKEVVLAVTIDPANYFFDNLHELPLFIFGPENLNGTLCTVVGLTPSDNDSVEVEAVVYDGDIFAADGDDPPPLPPPKTPDPIPGIPVLNCNSIRADLDPIEENKVRVSWSASYGASSYVVERSADGLTWTLAGSTSSNFLDIVTTPGEKLYIRVQPIGKGAGAKCSMAGGSGPGGGNPIPPPPGGTYLDYMEPVSPVFVAYNHRERGGTSEKIGFSEYTSPSTPPKKYLNLALDGTATVNAYTGPSDCMGGTLHVITNTYSGVCSYDPVTGFLTMGGSISTVTDGGAPSTATSCTVGSIGAPGDILTLTQTTKRFSNDAACHVTGTGSVQSPSGKNFGETLSVEDTEENALQRLKATLPDWATVDWSPCLGFNCGGSDWYAMTTTTTAAYSEGQFQIISTGIHANAFTLIRVPIYRIDLATSISVLQDIREFEVISDSLGAITYEFDFPNERGYAFTAGAPTYFQVPA